MKKNLFIILFILLLQIASFSVFHYKIQANFLPETHGVSATALISIENEKNLEFFLFPNVYSKDNPKIHALAENKYGFKRGYIHIREVKINGKKAEFEIKKADKPFDKVYFKDNLILKVKGNIRDKNINLEISFYTKFPEMASADEDYFQENYAWRFGWYPIPLKRKKTGKILYYFPPHTFELKINLPENWKLISFGEYKNGVYYSKIPVFSCPIFITKEHQMYELEGRNYRIEIYYLPGRRQKAGFIASEAMKILDFYTEKYGSLDYKVIRIIESKIEGVYGMTADGFVLLGEGLFLSTDLMVPGLFSPTITYLLAHELAHLWFGIGVGVDFYESNFISESFAQYLSIYYMEKTLGQDYIVDDDVPDIFVYQDLPNILILNRWKDSMIYSYIRSVRNYGDFNSSDSIADIPNNSQYQIYYAKALFALRSIETYLGEEKMNEFIKELHIEYRRKLLDKNKYFSFLNKYVDEKIIKDLYLSNKPLDIKIKKKSNKFFVDTGNRNIPYEIEIDYFNRKSEKIKVVGNTVISTPVYEIRNVVVDPDLKTFDVDRYNNSYYPRVQYKKSLISRLLTLENPLKKVPYKSPVENYILEDIYLLNFSGDITSNLYMFQNVMGYRFSRLTDFDLYLLRLEVGLFNYPNYASITSYRGIFDFYPNDFLNMSYILNLYTTSATSGFYEEINAFDVYANLKFSIPSRTDIGLFSPYISPKHNFSIGGMYYYSIDKKSYYYELDLSYNFNDLINNGFMTEINYTFDSSNLNVIRLDVLKFFDFYENILPGFEAKIAHSFDQASIKLFDDKKEILAGSSELINKVFTDLYTVSLGFNFNSFAKRINYYNQYSLDGNGLNLDLALHIGDMKDYIGEIRTVFFNQLLYFLDIPIITGFQMRILVDLKDIEDMVFSYSLYVTNNFDVVSISR